MYIMALVLQHEGMRDYEKSIAKQISDAAVPHHGGSLEALCTRSPTACFLPCPPAHSPFLSSMYSVMTCKLQGPIADHIGRVCLLHGSLWAFAARQRCHPLVQSTEKRPFQAQCHQLLHECHSCNEASH